MPLLDVILNRGADGSAVRELHAELTAIGAVITADEQAATTFSDSTAAAVRAFRQRFGLSAGDSVDLPTGRLLHVVSAFSGTGGRVALRDAVREAASVVDTSEPEELYWLARYATLAGEYQTARDITRLIPEHGGVRALIDPILTLPDHPLQPDPGQPPAAPRPQPPELPYPENFYTYRRDLYPLDVLDDVQRQVAAVGQPPRDPDQARPDPLGPTGDVFIQSAVSWLEAIKQWQIGNAAFNTRNYGAAQVAYDACQAAACTFFRTHYSIDLGSGPLTERLSNLIRHLANNEAAWATVWSRIRWRRGLLSLEELRAWDWPEPPPNVHVPRRFDPSPVVGELPPKPDYGLGFIQQYFQRGEFEDPATPARQQDLEAPLITLAFVLVPLARAEANRARRQFDAAIRDLRWVLDSILVRTIRPPHGDPGPIRSVFARLACEFIELPFAKLLLAETMLDRADAEHKARIAAEPPPAPDVAAFQGLKAAQTYLAMKDLFGNEGEYVARVDASRDQLAQQIQQHLAANETRSPTFQLLGKAIHVPTIASTSTTLPGLDRRVKAHEPLLTFNPPDGQTVMRETNPRVYAALLTATARLEQLKAGFNYLGYSDSYVPPWRFQFLLERARYFAEHARNAQREYLNFLTNAEREEFQELSTSQNVELEKSNVRIETARVDQVRLETQAAKESASLATLHAANAKESFEEYQEFDEYADRILDTAGLGVIGAALDVIGEVPGLGTVLGGVGDFFGGGGVSRAQERLVAAAQRDLEKRNLERAAEEARIAAAVAGIQLAAAEAGLVVAGLQRQAALLRHEFALQNLEFLRNRVLNTEQWYRLAAAIRGVSETYLRYSIELAFLAEQAYEFEADKRVNVIRFDYDLSEVGNFLAADFLVRDLNTLEQDLVVTQRQRQQQVRYVLSMAREFPEALQEIRDRGKTMFSLALEQIEKRFPGLYNVRIGAVDVLPVALMDSTRFSLELTHLGTSQVRLKGQPDTPPGTPSPSPLNTNDVPVSEGGWLAELQATWPVKLRVTGPEATVFSGLTRQDASAVFAFATAGQRHAFEALGAAAAWQVDFTARENQVVPGTLADLLITLTLSGYHDPELRRAIDRAPRPLTAATRWLSARTTFPDALYEFNRSGRMIWKVTRDLLTLTDTLGAVRNLAILLLPTPGEASSFGRVMSRYEVQVWITPTGELEVLSEIPQVTFDLGSAATPLVLTAQATLRDGAETSWDFGDGSPRQLGAEQQHSYAKPGRYTVTLRVVRNGRLSEFRADVVVSRSHADRLSPPVTAFPTLTRDTGTGIPDGHTRVAGTVNAPAADPVIANWRIGDQGGIKGNSATFDLTPGDYTLFFTAVRLLKARVHCTQRHLTAPVFDFNGLSLASNRRFELNGTETTGVGDNPPANPVAAHLFAEGALSPVDEWTVELPLADNACLRSVGATDAEQYGLAEIQDVVLALEYETTPGSS
jgi:hypothetical protein